MAFLASRNSPAASDPRRKTFHDSRAELAEADFPSMAFRYAAAPGEPRHPTTIIDPDFPGRRQENKPKLNRNNQEFGPEPEGNALFPSEAMLGAQSQTGG